MTEWTTRTSVGIGRDVYDDLQSLVDKSLIVAESSDDELRFRMMEIIREFGLEQAAQADELNILKRRHLSCYAAKATLLEDGLIGPGQAIWMRLVDNELGNIRLALQSALDLGGEAYNDGLHMALHMWRYWLIRGQLSEGVAWLRSMLDVPTTVPVPVRARAMNNLANLEFELGNHEHARRGYMESKDLYESVGDKGGVADELNNLGMVHLHDGNFDAASEVLTEALEIRQTVIDRSSLPTILSNLGDIAMHRSDLDLAEQYHLQAYQIRTEYGNIRGIALSCYNLGVVSLLRHDWEQADIWFETGWVSAREIQDTFTHACLWLGVGKLRNLQGQPLEAVQLLSRSLRSFREMDVRRMSLSMW